MISDNSNQAMTEFVAKRLPWVLAAAMFVVYLVTLNHDVTPVGIAWSLDTMGWTTTLHPIGPVTYLVTYPLRWLPVTVIPIALSLFSAICAALTLFLLARSVAILPHDRTYDQRERETSPNSFLSNKLAWLPPIFAVLVCGLQITFWDNAVQATEETFDLLLFAYVIRCLLEYRVSDNRFWMYSFALVYGLGIANSFAFIGFFPLFLAALIWIRGMAFFNTRFLTRIFLLGLLGASLYFLLPLVYQLKHSIFTNFSDAFVSRFKLDKQFIFRFPREIFLLLSLTSILPIFVISIRWASQFGDRSPVGTFVATALFHLTHALLLLAALWSFLGAPISPRAMGHGIPLLTLYYLSALSVGYISGYFLIIFRPLRKRDGSFNSLLPAAHAVVTALVILLFLAVPTLLAVRGLPFLMAQKKIDRNYLDFAEMQLKFLPASNTIIFSDDAARLAYLQAVIQKKGKKSDYALVNTANLNDFTNFPRYLAAENPTFKLPTQPLASREHVVTEESVVKYMDQLVQHSPIYYLHPSFGFFFERFYPEEQGLVFQLKHYASDAWDAPLASSEQIARNDQAWHGITNQSSDLLKTLHGGMTNQLGGMDKFFLTLKIKPEFVWSAFLLGQFYSCDLNFWGVELQKAGHLDAASNFFVMARSYNAFNVSAYYNSQFNQALLQKKTMALKNVQDLQKIVSPHLGWSDTLLTDGPVDDPSLRNSLASTFIHGGNLRQAIQQLDRIKKLVPNDLGTPLRLSQLFIILDNTPTSPTFAFPVYRCLADAIENADLVLQKSPREPEALFQKAVALMQQNKYADALPYLDMLLTDEPGTLTARLNRAIANLKTGHFDSAKADYIMVRAKDAKLPQIYYGLGEIAYHQKHVAEAIDNYQLYFTVAPSNTEEGLMISNRLWELRGSKH